MIDILLVLNFVFLIVYLIMNSIKILKFNKIIVISIGIIEIIAYILFLQGQIIFLESNLIYFYSSILNYFVSILKFTRSILLFIILLIMELIFQRLFQCIKSLLCIFILNDKVLDVMKNIQHNAEIIYEYDKLENTNKICQLIFIFNIIGAVILILSIIEIIVLKKKELFRILFFSSFLFKAPTLLISIVTTVPIIEKYNIHFKDIYYDMGELTRKNKI